MSTKKTATKTAWRPSRPPTTRRRSQVRSSGHSAAGKPRSSSIARRHRPIGRRPITTATRQRCRSGEVAQPGLGGAVVSRPARGRRRQLLDTRLSDFTASCARPAGRDAALFVVSATTTSTHPVSIWEECAALARRARVVTKWTRTRVAELGVGRGPKGLRGATAGRAAAVPHRGGPRAGPGGAAAAQPDRLRLLVGSRPSRRRTPTRHGRRT